MTTKIRHNVLRGVTTRSSVGTSVSLFFPRGLLFLPQERDSAIVRKVRTYQTKLCHMPRASKFHGNEPANLQKAEHKLNLIITEYGVTISVRKTKSMVFKVRDQVRTKIIIDNKTIEQV